MIVSTLFTVITFLLFCLIGLWIMIGISLIYRKRRTKKLLQIENVFAELISCYLYPLPGEKMEVFQIQRQFRELGIVEGKPKNVQYLQDLMLRTQATFIGDNYNKIEIFYTQIPPYRASLQKLRSKKWYIKARGIREIYQMDQEQYIKEILKERNNKNIYVRREAQIAMVVFLGWESLRFLPYLKWEMTLWQQIQIVEKLWYLYPQPDLKRLRKSYTSEKKYANELIMRIIRKFDLREEIDYIIRFLDDPNFDTRESAVYCISSFEPGEEQLRAIKSKLFNIPNTEQQRQLVKYISSLPVDVDLTFYSELLHRGNDVIKLSAAEVLWNKGYVKEVQDFYYRQYSYQPTPEFSLFNDV